MSLFKKPAVYDLDACQRALRENADAIAQAEQEIAEHSLAGVTGDDHRATDAAARIVQLQAQRRVLEQAARQVEAKERDAAGAKDRRQAESRARACDQHCAALRRHADAMQRAIGDLVDSHREARSALERIAACVGDVRDYDGLGAAQLVKTAHAELWRASAVPSQVGDRSDLIAAPPGAGPANRLPALTEIVGSLTKHWAARHRAALGLQMPPAEAQDERKPSPARDTPAAVPAAYTPPEDGRRHSIGYNEIGRL